MTDMPEAASDQLHTALRLAGYTGRIDRFGRASSGDPETDALWNLRVVKALTEEKNR